MPKHLCIPIQFSNRVPGTVSLMDFTAKGDAPVPSYAQGLFVPGEIWAKSVARVKHVRKDAHSFENYTQKMGNS